MSYTILQMSFVDGVRLVCWTLLAHNTNQNIYNEEGKQTILFIFGWPGMVRVKGTDHALCFVDVPLCAQFPK